MGLLKNWLEKKSYKVKYTGKSNAVISLLEEFPADIILVDLL